MAQNLSGLPKDQKRATDQKSNWKDQKYAIQCNSATNCEGFGE